MVNYSVNGAVVTSSAGWMGWSQAACNVALPSVSVVGADGNAYMQIVSMRLGLSGKDASRTVQLGIWSVGNTLLQKTNSFTVAAASSASLTSYQNLATTPVINRTSISTVRVGFWVSGNGSVYYQRDDTSQSMDIQYDSGSSSSATTFTSAGTLNSNSSLVGNFNYYILPTAPQSLTAAASQGQVNLNWSAPSSDGGTAITSYTLQRATDAGFTTGLVTTTGLTSTTTNVTGLTNGTTYYFRVAAVNAVASAASTTSAYSSTVSATPSTSATTPGAPTAATLAQVSPQNPTALTASWTAPSSNGGSAITGYSIKYSTSIAGLSSATPLTVGAVTSATIGELSTNTTYYFQVAAINAIGTGPYSNIASNTTYLTTSGTNGVIKRWSASAGAWVVVV